MSHNHSHQPESFNLAFALAVSCNLVFTLVEVGAAFFAHSMSLMADAVHNLGDVFSLVMAWFANWLLTRLPTERYSYGYKKVTLLAALANALILVFTSALIVYEAIDKLIAPGRIQEVWVMIVALIGILVNGGTAFLFLKGSAEDLNIKGAFLHLAVDALISVGVVLTGLAIWYTHQLWIDPIAGLLIVAIILYGTWDLLIDSVNWILGAVPCHIDPRGVRQYLSQIKGVVAVHDLHIWALSTREIALTVHLVMPEKDLSDADHAEINRVLHEKFHIHHVTLQVEKGEMDYPCHRAETCQAS